MNAARPQITQSASDSLNASPEQLDAASATESNERTKTSTSQPVKSDVPIIKFCLQDCTYRQSRKEKIEQSAICNFYSTSPFADRGHINQSEIERVKEMITILLSRQYLLSDVVVPSDDTLCTICYSESISATFHPCKHQSCCGCITQHLMNSKLCFYCKATIATVINFDGNCIFEQISESSEAEITP